MKSIVAILALSLGLGLCNLSSWSNKNANNSNNANRAPSTTEERQISEPVTTPNSALLPPPPPVRLSESNEPPPPPPKATPRAPISAGVLNGKAISLPTPRYPPIAKAAHASGQVSVQVVVDEEGKVLTAHAVSGHPLLQAAAVAAARQARFSPTKLSGQPVKVTGVIIYHFVEQ